MDKITKEALLKRRKINSRIFKFECLSMFIFFGLVYMVASYHTSNSRDNEFKEAQQFLITKEYEKGINAINTAIGKKLFNKMCQSFFTTFIFS
ncbi:hypothetical protein [Aquimarina longa]|uniref:hypothetical protein n=1 Tax=Aquimarina longa TaxID=1080221 RepID=UPI000782D9D5|nr:hypothetical protein [Aquimarina longa]